MLPVLISVFLNSKLLCQESKRIEIYTSHGGSGNKVRIGKQPKATRVFNKS